MEESVCSLLLFLLLTLLVLFCAFERASHFSSQPFFFKFLLRQRWAQRHRALFDDLSVCLHVSVEKVTFCSRCFSVMEWQTGEKMKKENVLPCLNQIFKTCGKQYEIYIFLAIIKCLEMSQCEILIGCCYKSKNVSTKMSDWKKGIEG